MPCDSHTRLDGEGLRSVVSSNAEALAYLDRYQRNRKKLKWLPYLGTSAILLVGTGVIIGKKVEGTSAIAARNILAVTGLAIFAGGFGYGLIMLSLNEKNLKNSIRKFNEANPNDPIEIQVQTRFFL